MNYDDMPAGREMDRLVAEMVMGWKHSSGDTGWYDHGIRRRCIQPAINMGVVALLDDEDILWDTFYPSAKIEDAWEVVEHLRTRENDSRPYICIEHIASNGWWRCTFSEEFWLQKDGTAQADTAPLAICRAALKAVGKA